MSETGIWGYEGTLQELAISIGRMQHKEISKLLELVSDEVYKKAIKLNDGELTTVVCQLDAASKGLNKEKLCV